MGVAAAEGEAVAEEAVADREAAVVVVAVASLWPTTVILILTRRR